MANSLNLKTFNLYETLDPERNLWRNVLIVALEDAMGLHYSDKNYSYNKASSPRAYFLEPNRDFKMVCTLAGFDHEYVRMKVRKYFEKNRKKEENDEKNYLSTL
jgi:hypothetical protein|tara:strand:- start:836 stop:1147 length:312 start_codon:yes stop_codon:yes gene_type:complete